MPSVSSIVTISCGVWYCISCNVLPRQFQVQTHCGFGVVHFLVADGFVAVVSVVLGLAALGLMVPHPIENPKQARSQPTQPSQEPPAVVLLPRGPPRRRGRSENTRPRPKSMINTGEVREAYMASQSASSQRPRLNTHSGGRPSATVAKPVTRPKRTPATSTTSLDVAYLATSDTE
ncbi:hypothetical protein FHG87_007805 [Trinorchestia longiramus]|nr:hypothetical protein FHG87_007805 [Trinorchestia longiramus]